MVEGAGAEAAALAPVRVIVEEDQHPLPDQLRAGDAAASAEQ